MQRMIINVLTAPRPKARRAESMEEQERRAVEELAMRSNELLSAGWVPLGPMVALQTILVQQFYAMAEVPDEEDEEE